MKHLEESGKPNFSIHLRIYCKYAWDIVNGAKTIELRKLVGKNEEALRKLKMGDLIRFEVIHRSGFCMESTLNR